MIILLEQNLISFKQVFWFDYIIPMLKASRDAIPEGKPLDPTLLHDGFLRVNFTRL